MKPLLERKRRARINKCLDELKDLMTTALQEDGENLSKLEKADILELTVRHLHKMTRMEDFSQRNPVEELKRFQVWKIKSNPRISYSSGESFFQTGYTSCAHEAASFLLNIPGVDLSVGQGLLSYLSSQVNLSMASTGAIPSLTGIADHSGTKNVLRF